MVNDFLIWIGKQLIDNIIDRWNVMNLSHFISLKTVPEGIDTSSFWFIVAFCIKFFEDINLPNKPLVRHHRFFCVLLYVLFSLKYSWAPYRPSNHPYSWMDMNDPGKFSVRTRPELIIWMFWKRINQPCDK